MRIAVLVDGAFFLYRFPHVYRQVDGGDPKVVARTLHRMACAHLYRTRKNGERLKQGDLYRVFFYDCPPLEKRVHRPISKRSLNFSKEPSTIFRNALHTELRGLRKVALRLGRLDEKNARWQLKDAALKALIRGDRNFEDLIDEDFIYYARQKVVDTKIGVDIALLAEKRLVDRIVLIAGDSDFVPAAKHARREGVDVVLDPMWNHIAPDLHEHIDGLRSTCPNPTKPKAPELVDVDEADLASA